MAGKTYVGNSSSKSAVPKNIYVGNSSNKSAAVKVVYVGNSSNKSVKVWPTSLVPSGYTQVEYIGNVLISLGDIYAKNNPRVVAEFELDPSFNPFDYEYVFGYQAYNPPNTDCNYAFGIANRYFTVFYGLDNGDGDCEYDLTAEAPIIGNRYIVDFNNISGSTSRFYLAAASEYYSVASHQLIHSESTKTMKMYSGYSDQGRIYLLGSNYITGSDGSSGIRLYNCNVYNKSGTLIRKLIPCYKNSDKVIGLYDLANTTFLASINNSKTTTSGVLVGPEI